MRNRSIVFIAACFFWFSSAAAAEPFQSSWSKDIERTWVGPEYWANRLQDWQISKGRLECITGGYDRNVHLLTRQLGEQNGTLAMTVRLGRLGSKLGKGWVGFRIGANTSCGDYRRNAIYGKGVDLGVTTSGRLFIAELPGNRKGLVTLDDVELRLAVEPAGDFCRIVLSAHDPGTGKIVDKTSDEIAAEKLIGNLALVCHQEEDRENQVRFWFSSWTVSGSKIDINDDHAFGPILFAQHTLNNNIMKMTAQMPPIAKTDSQFVHLQIRDEKGYWKAVGRAEIDGFSRTAAFRITEWDSSRDILYRLVYQLADGDGRLKKYYWIGTIRRDPVEKETIVIAGFTGNNDLGFPNDDIVRHVSAHNPDVLVFTGDQIYERVAGYGVQYKPVDKACLDYLRKWYIFGWSFGELMKYRPTICLPDDHDVYHGNLWGAGGIHAPQSPPDGNYPPEYKGASHKWTQDRGGYKMPPEWVRMVERTQTSHLPDPYDPMPIEQGIGVYYCAMNYGGVSFAIIEDRKFKSSPTVMIPEGNVVNGWFQNRNFDPAKKADVPGAVLIGDRQLNFLRDWAADWSDKAWMKVVISQTTFANVATLPGPATTDDVVPKLRLVAPGEYPENDEIVADADSDAWPQTGRNKALREMRRAFAFHLAGDQHLGSTIQYGIDRWNDAGFAFCVPAIANIWPRRWFPPQPGINRKPDSPKYTGDFRDGFGNLITVHAVSNPVISGREPSELHDRATGYGIVKLNRNQRTITVECWPRYADPADPSTGGQYEGWPVTIKQTDNYDRKPAAFLPAIKVKGMTDPVVQVIDQSDNEIVYTLRIKGDSFHPKVFKEGTYTIKVGEPDTGQIKTLKDMHSVSADKSETIEVGF